MLSSVLFIMVFNVSSRFSFIAIMLIIQKGDTFIYEYEDTRHSEEPKICTTGCRPDIRIHCSIQKLFSEPFAYVDTKDTPAKPSSIAVTEILNSTNRKVRLKVAWTLPNDVSFRSISGFLLIVINQNTNEYIYRRVNLNGTNWKNFTISNTTKMTLYYDCLPYFTYGSLVYMQLYSLPRPFLNSDFREISHRVTRPGQHLYINTYIIPNVSPINQCSYSVRVLFNNTAQIYGINIFKIQLLTEKGGTEIMNKIIHHNGKMIVNYTFMDVCPGNYSIRVEPLYWFAERCDKCMVHTKKIIMTDKTPGMSAALIPLIILIVVGSVSFITLSFVCIMTWKKRHRESQNENIYKGDNNSIKLAPIRPNISDSMGILNGECESISNKDDAEGYSC